MPEQAVVLFDGVCNLCHFSVGFIIDRDPKQYFKFASLQSDYGQDMLSRFRLNAQDFDSVVLIQNGAYYTKSSAALRIARHLNPPYNLGAVFLVIPKFLRDIGYDFIAKHRYQWFGKQESCRLPTPELKARFLDQ